MSSTFGALIDVESTPESASDIKNPPTARQGRPGPSVVELDELSFGAQYNGPKSEPQSGVQTPKTPGEMEALGSRTGHVPTEMVQTLTNPLKNKFRFLSACLAALGQGLNDSAPGALIPYIEKHYDISYGTVSLIFVANALGFILAAPVTNMLLVKLGRAKMLAMALSLMIVACTALVCTPPFPVVVVAFFPAGLSISWALALNNVFCANLVNATQLLGVFHGSYGVGGFLGPLIATAMVSSGRKWSSFYAVTLGLAAINTGFSYWAFSGYEEDTANPLLTTLERHISQKTQPATKFRSRHSKTKSNVSGPTPTPTRKFVDIIRSRVTILGALFIFSYQGAEVSISGWVLSYLLASRQHSSSQNYSLGYVTSGFWGGITMGRFVLSHPAHRIGEKLAVSLMVAGATAFQLLVWFLPNIIGDAVAVAIVGLMLGAVFPCVTFVLSKLMTKDDLMPALAFISAMGSSGGAIAPLVTGLLSQRVGTYVLHPIAISLFACMGACWFGLPHLVKRQE